MMSDRMMKAARLYSIGDFRSGEVPVPVPHGDELLLKVGACGVCGSDFPRIYEHGTSSGIYPLTLGHEFAGEIEAVGETADPSLVGRRGAIFPLIPCRTCDPCITANYVMCEHYDYMGSRRDGAFAEYCLVPSAWHFIESKNNASMEALAMTEPACVGQHAVRRGNVTAGQYVVIFGAGAIGIMAARWVEIFGGRALLADIVQSKVDFAREKGLDAVNSGECDVAEEIRRRNGGRLADAAIEGTGVGSVFCSCVECVRAHGTVSMMGNPAGDMTVPVNIHSMLLRKEITINGIWNSSRAPYPVNEWEFTVKMMDVGRLIVDDLITDRVTVDELPGVIGEIHDRKRFPVKTMCVF